MADSAAISLGPGTLYVTDIATADPTSASATLPSAWRQVGYTEEGSTFEYQLTTESVFVAEALDPVRTDSTKREGKLSFSMAEMTRQNLALALNEGAAVANSTALLEPGALGAELRVKIILDTQSGARWLFRKCFNGGQISIAHKKAPDKALIPVEFTLELPTGAAAFGVFPAAGGYI